MAVVAALGWEEAHLLAGRLRSEGIRTGIYPDEDHGLSTLYGHLMSGTFEVIVAVDDLEEARSILDQVQRGG